MKNLLVELQTEELPPKALLKLSRAFADGIAKHLGQQHFLTEESVVAPYGSPRRLAVRITNVLEKSPDEAFAQKLVPVRVGLTPEGEATPALTKKMAALGIQCDVSALKRVQDGKNEQLVFEGVRPGVELAAGLQTALDAAVKELPIPKVMTYQLADGETTVAFVRPVKHLVALLGDDVVPVKLFGLDAGRVTMGHRFMTSDPVEIATADAYADTMKAAFVMADFEERRELLRKLLTEAGEKAGGSVIMPEDLLEEVTALTEWPVVYESSFEEEFLQVPEECLILTMQLNQRYFALRDADGKLMNRFLLVSQLVARDGGKAISSGNARVVRARLADAKFFYDQDRLQTLESRVEGLKHVVYHNKLGNQAERMLRVKTMAGRFASLIGADTAHAERAAMLAKADLRTLMVGEFPELQGIMGEYYARHDGEPDDVALAIREHYQPRYAGDALPSRGQDGDAHWPLRHRSDADGRKGSLCASSPCPGRSSHAYGKGPCALASRPRRRGLGSRIGRCGRERPPRRAHELLLGSSARDVARHGLQRPGSRRRARASPDASCGPAQAPRRRARLHGHAGSRLAYGRQQAHRQHPQEGR